VRSGNLFCFINRCAGGDTAMEFHLMLQPILAIIAGILILIIPQLLNYIVAIFLIVYGVLGLF
jgi:hypothetical protein